MKTGSPKSLSKWNPRTVDLSVRLPDHEDGVVASLSPDGYVLDCHAHKHEEDESAAKG